MEASKKLSIAQWAEEDRPREKMIINGVTSLSDAELLAILISSGSKNESAVELMRRVLASCDHNLNDLGKWGLPEFARYKGIGPAKATTIMAALELGKRRKGHEIKDRKSIVCSSDVYEIFYPIMCDLAQEEFWILLLNQANKVICKTRISTGGIDGTYADVRSILREALLNRATGIILSHNHPSGNINPSESDKKLTSAIVQGAMTMNIRVSDHVIISDGKYFSFADEDILH